MCVKRGIKAIDLISQSINWNLGHVVICAVLPTLDTLLECDDKPPTGTESTNVAEPRIDYVLGSCRNGKPTKAPLTRLDLDLNGLWPVKLKVIEPFRREAVDSKVCRSQPGCEPSTDGILEMKATTCPRAGARVAPHRRVPGLWLLGIFNWGLGIGFARGRIGNYDANSGPLPAYLPILVLI